MPATPSRPITPTPTPRPGPQPVQRAGFTPRPLGAAPSNASHGARTVTTKDPDLMYHPTTLGASGTAVQPTLLPPRERILLMADSDAGKTYAWLRLAEQEFNLAKTEDREPARFFCVDTDNTLPKFLNKGYEFAHLYCGNGGNVYPYPAFDWPAIAKASNAIFRQMRANDWYIVDVINRVYDQAQAQVAEKRGKNVADSAITRAFKNQGFGAFAADDWNIVTRIFDTIAHYANFNIPGNCLFISHVTDMIDAPDRERRTALVMFDSIGLKPRGAPKMPGMVDTVIAIWNVRIINRDEKKKRTGQAKTARKVAVLKDRGEVNDPYVDYYDRDLFVKLQQIRGMGIISQNVTDPKELEELEAEASRQRSRSAQAPAVDAFTGEIHEDDPTPELNPVPTAVDGGEDA